MGKQHGIVLLVVLISLQVLILLSLLSYELAMLQLKMAHNDQQSIQAQQLAYEHLAQIEQHIGTQALSCMQPIKAAQYYPEQMLAGEFSDCQQLGDGFIFTTVIEPLTLPLCAQLKYDKSSAKQTIQFLRISVLATDTNERIASRMQSTYLQVLSTHVIKDEGECQQLDTINPGRQSVWVF